jgi:hypothetical protein
LALELEVVVDFEIKPVMFERCREHALRIHLASICDVAPAQGVHPASLEKISRSALKKHSFRLFAKQEGKDRSLKQRSVEPHPIDGEERDVVDHGWLAGFSR